MERMKLSGEMEDIFVLKTEKTDKNKTVKVEIHDLIKMIDHQEDKKKRIVSPQFKVGDTSLTVQVYPHDWRENSKEFIAVYVNNKGKNKITATFTLKHASGVVKTFKNQEIKAKTVFGDTEFLSHAAYMEWAEDHGDVFRVEVKVTLHVEKPAQWTTKR